MYIVKHSESVVRAEAKFPFGLKSNLPFQRFAIRRFNIRLILQIALDSSPDEQIIFTVNCFEVRLRDGGVYQGKFLSLRHDHNYSHLEKRCQRRNNYRLGTKRSNSVQLFSHSGLRSLGKKRRSQLCVPCALCRMQAEPTSFFLAIQYPGEPFFLGEPNQTKTTYWLSGAFIQDSSVSLKMKVFDRSG